LTIIWHTDCEGKSQLRSNDPHNGSLEFSTVGRKRSQQAKKLHRCYSWSTSGYRHHL